jgi:hypothetical protein
MAPVQATGPALASSPMETLGQVLLLVAIFVALLGGTLLLLSRLGLQRFPGDVGSERENVTIYVPLGLMIGSARS